MKIDLVCDNTRSDLYKLLSDCYYAPDEKLIGALKAFKESENGLPLEIIKNIPEVDDIVSLKIDYSKLFLGPYKLLAPPYGSVYLEGARKVMGNSTMDVKRWYREEGLDITVREAPDHIAVELEFMYLLIFREAELMKNKDSNTAFGYCQKQASFLGTHLGRWVNEFTSNVEASAHQAFYKKLARFTKSFIEEDQINLANRCNSGY